MKPPAPPRVRDPTQYLAVPPPAMSARCAWWLDRIGEGWRPNQRIRSLGYDGRAYYFGVYIWEQVNIIDPALPGGEA